MYCSNYASGSASTTAVVVARGCVVRTFASAHGTTLMSPKSVDDNGRFYMRRCDACAAGAAENPPQA